MARPGRFELPTLCLEGRRSIQLSYGRILECALDSTALVQLIRVPVLRNNLERLDKFDGWNSENDKIFSAYPRRRSNSTFAMCSMCNTLSRKNSD